MKVKPSPLKRRNRQNLRIAQGGIDDHYSDPSNLSEQDYLYFRSRAVPDRLTRLNIKRYQGRRAAEIFGVAGENTKQAEAVKRGGWLAFGATLSGEKPASPIFRADQPRIVFDNGKLKTVKFETRAGAPALPILPHVDQETAQAVYKRHNVQPLPGESFWQVVYRCNLPIAITEGLAKALALIAHGIPAIALRGVTCWHPKGKTELYEQIKDFATAGRKIYVGFDQDSKPTTVRNVNKQIKQLGEALLLQKCSVSVLQWDAKQGKGIDDALAGQGSYAQDWLDLHLKIALPFQKWKQVDRVQKFLSIIQSLSSIAIKSERETSGRYIPELSPLEQGVIYCIDAPTGTGKTRQTGALIKSTRLMGWNVLALTPQVSLGGQSASRWDLTHRNGFDLNDVEQRKAFHLMISAEHGVVMCPQSLHHIPDWFINDRPLLLVLDEINQVLDELVQGNTLGSRQPEVLERFSQICRAAIERGAIIASEANIQPRAIEFLQKLSGCEKVRIFRHTQDQAFWRCKVTQPGSGYWGQMIETLRSDKKLILCTASRLKGEQIERVVRGLLPGKRVTRIDSKTNQNGQFSAFWENPDRYLEDNGIPDLLILSPSAKSGVSITIPGFDQVWGYFPCLHGDTHLQMLGRYRLPVDRVIAVPKFIQTFGDEALSSVRRVQQRLQHNYKGLTGLYGLDELLSQEDSEKGEMMAILEEACTKYYSQMVTVIGCQKAIARDYLIHQLKQIGHTVDEIILPADKGTQELLNEALEEIWWDDAKAIATTEISPEYDVQWAHRQLDNAETSEENRLKAHKVIWRDEFPGVLFDDEDECYGALCEDFGKLRRGVLLQARSENLEAVKNLDREAAASLLGKDVRLLHKLPRNYVKARLIAETGILELLDGKAYTNADPRVVEIKKKALYWAREIEYWLGLQIKLDQTAVHIANKLLKRISVEAKQISRPGRRSEKRDRLFRVDESPLRMRLLDAARLKLAAVVPKFEQVESIVDRPTPSMPTPDQGSLIGSVVRWGSSLGDWLVVGVGGSIAKIRQVRGYASQMIHDVLVDELVLVDRQESRHAV